MAAQAYLKLGEVGAESGMISMCCFLHLFILLNAKCFATACPTEHTRSYVDFILHPISDHLALPPPSGVRPLHHTLQMFVSYSRGLPSSR